MFAVTHLRKAIKCGRVFTVKFNQPWSALSERQAYVLFRCAYFVTVNFQGVYKGTDAAIDVSTFLLLSSDSDGWFWKVHANLFNEKLEKEIMCLVAEAQIAVTNV